VSSLFQWRGESYRRVGFPLKTGTSRVIFFTIDSSGEILYCFRRSFCQNDILQVKLIISLSLLCLLIVFGLIWSLEGGPDPEEENGSFPRVPSTRAEEPSPTSAPEPEEEIPSRDHGEIQKSARKAWSKDKTSFAEFYENLSDENERLVALHSMKREQSDDPEYFASLIARLFREGSRNALREDLLFSIYENQSPKDAVNFIFRTRGVGHRRTHELYPIYFRWFKASPAEVIADGGRLEFAQDLKVFERLLDQEKQKIALNEFQVALENGLNDKVIKKIANYTLENIRASGGEEAVLEAGQEDPRFLRFVGE
jgi:hypothetical protein